MRKPWKTILLTTAAIMMITAGCGQPAQTAPPSNPTQGGSPSTSQPPNDPNNTGENNSENEPAENNEDTIDPNEASDKVTETVTLYFTDTDLMNNYSVEREVSAESAEDLPKAALEAWMAGPDHEGLGNLVPPGVVVEYVKGEGGIAEVSFSSELKNANLGSSGEMFLLEQIALIMKQFGYDSTQILIEGEIEESLLGHVTTSEPISPPPADEIQPME
ncbi:GerMN domain-containing protein [Paenibacillus senegalensis]|uniref:GerMN domain-containing protein n=1 Tax=Paenibacillus senegalensis TaxID=1465766 RepID=UPI0002883099|nr:GerMN domain-containing protein [Paenibacillus senegalensis]